MKQTRVQFNLNLEEAETIQHLIKDYGQNYHYKGKDTVIIEAKLTRLINKAKAKAK